MLSVILITKNEEKNIQRCLASLAFAPEIVIVDAESTDRTVTLAQTFPNTKVLVHPWQGFVENKKIALQHTSYDWVLWIDADEVVPPGLATACLAFCTQADQDKWGGLEFPRKTFFLGHWVRHSGWYPNYTVRLFHKHRAHFKQRQLHESIVVQPNYATAHSTQDLLHYSYTSLYQYFDKMNRYGAAGAQELLRRQKPVFSIQLVAQPLWTFFRFFVLKRGFLDGYIGLIVCLGAAFSNFIKYTNYLFLKKQGRTEL